MGSKVAEVALKALAGGLFVLAFAALAQMIAPKRFAGVFSAAPSVALGSLLVTVAFAGGHHDEDDLALSPAKLRETGARDWLIRLGFGAGVSGLAGTVSALAGARAGGLFLAFPAILLASLTLVAQEEGVRQARNEARGATFGALGLVVFATVVAVLTGRAPVWLALTAASAARTVVALGGYLVARWCGAGGDEPAA
jgi:hypothetical protein